MGKSKKKAAKRAQASAFSSDSDSEAVDLGPGYIGSRVAVKEEVVVDLGKRVEVEAMDEDPNRVKKRVFREALSDESEHACGKKRKEKRMRAIEVVNFDDESTEEPDDVIMREAKGVNVGDTGKNGRIQGDCELNTAIANSRRIGDGLRDVVCREANKIGKNQGRLILGYAADYEELITRLLAENERLKGRVEELTKSPFRADGGVAVSGAASRPVVTSNAPVAAKSYAVIVRSQEKISPEEIKKRACQGVSECRSVRVKSVKNIRDGGVVIETPSEKDRTTLKSCQTFVEKGLSLEQPKKLASRLIIYDVPCNITDDEIKRDIFYKNVDGIVERREYANSFKIVSRRLRKEASSGNLVLEVDEKSRERLAREKRVYIGFSVYKVNEYDRIFQCFGCYGFGHSAKECKKDRRCIRCGEPGHVGSSCRNAVSCTNCKARGQVADHMVTSTDCPEYKWRMAALRARM